MEPKQGVGVAILRFYYLNSDVASALLVCNPGGEINLLKVSK